MQGFKHLGNAVQKIEPGLLGDSSSMSLSSSILLLMHSVNLSWSDDMPTLKPDKLVSKVIRSTGETALEPLD